MKYLPMLAVKGETTILESEEHIFEPKLDGTRCIAEIGDEVRLFNRREKNITARYPEIVEELKNFEKCILDGEIICYNNGKPDFYRLQKREHIDSPFLIELRAKIMPATYVIFDVLERNEKELIKMPLVKRKEILSDVLIEGKHVEGIFYTEHGKKLWKTIRDLDIEGVMAKEKESFYYPGERRREWVKIKNTKSIDVVIVGYTSMRREISSLGMGLYDGDNLVYVGKTGTGFDEEIMHILKKKFSKRKKPCVANFQAAPPDMIWVEPEIVAEVEYLEVTDRKELRSPSFKRLRMDKKPEECTIEQLK